MQALFSLIRLAVLLFSLPGVAVTPACNPPGPDTIPVFAAPGSPRLRKVLAGLQEGLHPRRLEVAVVPEFGPEGAETLRRLRARRPPLLIVLGSPALTLVAPVEKRRPVVFAMVANPYATGAADFPQHPEIHQKNITGIASPPPLAPALEQGARLLGSQAWGLIYDPREGMAVEIARKFQELAPRWGITPLLAPSREESSDRRALEELLGQGARVFYLPPTATARRYAPLLLSRGEEGRILVVNGHPEVEGRGAVLRVILDYHQVGREAAALARRVLAGQKPEHIPISEKMPLQVTVDEGLWRRVLGYPGLSPPPPR